MTVDVDIYDNFLTNDRLGLFQSLSKGLVQALGAGSWSDTQGFKGTGGKGPGEGAGCLLTPPSPRSSGRSSAMSTA